MKLRISVVFVANLSTPSGCIDNLTEGKEYEVFGVNKSNDINIFNFRIIDDKSREIYCLLNNCGLLNNGNWIIKSESTPRNLTTTTINYKNCSFDVSGVWSGQYVEETNEKPEFELHTIEINGNDLTELLTQEARDGIVEMLVNE